jgi:hypothetical protein
MRFEFPIDEPGYWIMFFALALATFIAGILYQRNKH